MIPTAIVLSINDNMKTNLKKAQKTKTNPKTTTKKGISKLFLTAEPTKHLLLLPIMFYISIQHLIQMFASPQNKSSS